MIMLSCFSCLTVTTFAATIASDAQYDEEGNLVQMYWELSDTGTLTIHSDVLGTPWAPYADQIKEVIVK